MDPETYFRLKENKIDEGFVPPTFNQTIFELSKVTINLMTDSDDVE